MSFTQPLFAFTPLLAQIAGEESPKSYNLAWGVVMLCVVLGMVLTLRATKREPIEEKQPTV